MAWGHGLRAPFTLLCAGEALHVEHIFRWLPGRRLTARTHWRGQAVVLKLFLGRGAVRRCAREKRGALRLMAGAAATPRLLAEMAAPELGGRALLFECLPGGRPIASSPEPAAAEEAALAVRVLAQLHTQGLTHKDMHLDNFVLSEGKVYIVDGDGVAPMSSRSKWAGLRALATFLAAYPPAADGRAAGLLACYEQARNWRGGPSRLRQLRRWLRQARQRRIRRYLAKTGRNCTEFAVRKEPAHRCLTKREWAWGQGMAQSGGSLSRALLNALATAEVIKDGNSATVFRLELGGELVVVKRYNVRSLGHRLRAWFRPRSRRAWRNGHALRLLQIPTAEPLALLERRRGPFSAECHLLMRDLGVLDLATETRTSGWRPRPFAADRESLPTTGRRRPKPRRRQGHQLPGPQRPGPPHRPR